MENGIDLTSPLHKGLTRFPGFKIAIAEAKRWENKIKRQEMNKIKRLRRKIKRKEEKLEQAKQRTKEKRKKKKHVIRGKDRVPLDNVPQEYFIESHVFNAMSREDRQALLRKRDQMLRNQAKQKKLKIDRLKKERKQKKRELHQKVMKLICQRINHALLFNLEYFFQGKSPPMLFTGDETKMLQLYQATFPKGHISPFPMRSRSTPSRTRWKPLDPVHMMACVKLNELTGAYDNKDGFALRLLDESFLRIHARHHKIQWDPTRWLNS